MQPKLAVLTSVTRGEFLTPLVASFASLRPQFCVHWFPIIDMGEKKKFTIGGAWNEALKRATDEMWCILLDDDNIIHPRFADLFLADLNRSPNAPLFIFKQYEKEGGERSLTINPELKRGKVDAAQFGFQAKLARDIPFPNVSHQPDGLWAEALAGKQISFLKSDAPTYYNFSR